MTFSEALKHTLEFEGGYANDPADRGGETFRGVSRKNWPHWGGWKLIDQAKGRGFKTRRAIDGFFAQNAEMEALVADFYGENFWRPFERLGLPPRIAAKLFDAAVNVGVSRAVKILQETLGGLGAHLTADGKSGPLTIAAIKDVFARPGAEDGFMAGFIKRQEYFYRCLAKKPGQEKFLKGWLRRAAWAPAK